MKQYNLLDVCEVYQPQTIATKDFVDGGKYFVYGANGAIGLYDKYNHENSEVLMACRGASCGTINISKPYSWINGNAMVIHPKGTVPITQKYLAYCLKALDKRNIISGTAQPQITRNNMKDFCIPVCDVTEQEKIVCKIEELFSSLDNAVETLNKTKEQLLIYRQAVLKKAFESDKEWEECVLGDVISVLTDYHSNGSYKDLKAHVTLLDEPDYAIMIRSTNFEKDDFSGDLKFINEDSYNYLKKSQIFGGEVLMGKIGNAGRVYYMKNLNCPVSLAMNLFAMRFRDDVDSKFVYYYLKTNEATMDIKQYVKGVGTPTIDKKGVRRIKFRFPDKNRQIELVKEIERRLSSCDSIEKTIDIALKQSEAIRKSILKEAFEGRLI